MAILDNRTVVDLATSAANYVGTSPADDNEIFYQGSNSVAENFTNAVRTILFNAGATQNWSNNTFLILANCGIVGRLSQIASGGFSVRFTGPLTSDFFEVYVGGSDSWPTAFAGGWVYFIVDIEVAAASPSNTGGTPPATNAIQHVGIAGQTVTMPRNVDNTWLNGIWRLPSGTPGILVEGQNTGSVDWTFADIQSASETNLWGTFRTSDGGAYVSSVPIRIGNSTDSVTHGFTDTNQSLLWQSTSFISDSYYGVEVVGSATNIINTTWGVKSGTGTDATGSQGVLIQSDVNINGLRWYLTANSNIDSFNSYGCTFTNSDIIRAESSSAEVISTFLINGNEYVQSTSAASSIYLRNTVINANTADGEAYLKTVDIDNIDYSTFEFSDGHALEISSTSAASSNTFTSLENIFTGYTNVAGGADTDAAIYNNSGQEITIQQSGGSLGLDSYRNGVSSTTIIENKVGVKIENVLEGSEVRMWNYSGGPNGGPANTEVEISGGVESIANTDTLTTGSVTFNVDANLDVLVKVFKTDFNIERFVLNSGDGTTRRVDQSRDRVYNNPPN
jgi:hypothetical protein